MLLYYWFIFNCIYFLKYSTIYIYSILKFQPNKIKTYYIPYHFNRYFSRLVDTSNIFFYHWSNIRKGISQSTITLIFIDPPDHIKKILNTFFLEKEKNSKHINI